MLWEKEAFFQNRSQLYYSGRATSIFDSCAVGLKNQIGSSNGEKSVSWFQKNAWESSCLPVGLFVVRSSDALHNYFQVQIKEVKFFAPCVVPPSHLKVVMWTSMEGQLKEVVSFWYSFESNCELSCTSGRWCHAYYVSESLRAVSLFRCFHSPKVPGKWPCLKARTRRNVW